MAAPFSFGFLGDDVEVDDDDDDDDEAPKQHGRDPNAEHNSVVHEKSLPAKRHSLENLLANLPSCISYNYLDIPLFSRDTCQSESSHNSATASHAVSCAIPRRSLFDIRVQLLAESTGEENGDDDLISGFDRGDLSSGFYEGGFKTWECAVDLAGFVTNHVTLKNDESWEVIELGAGSGIPSLAIFRQALSRKRLGTEMIKFTSCDYNEEVLNLVTMPNVLLSWWDICINRSGVRVRKDLPAEADLDDINQDMTQRFVNDCKSKGISFDFISGGWGASFVDVIGSAFGPEADVHAAPHNLVILASETIYSPSSLTEFVSVVVGLLRATRGEGTAFVAAKRIYFGVGGGVQEFVHEMRKLGGLVNEVVNITDSGVGRVVLEVSLA